MNVEAMERLLEFCLGKIPDEDLMTLEEMLAAQIPAKNIAADTALKRRATLAMDCRARGYAVQRKRGLHNIAQDRDAILALHPHMFRLDSSSSNFSFIPPGEVMHSQKPSRPMTSSERAAAKKMFPNMYKED